MNSRNAKLRLFLIILIHALLWMSAGCTTTKYDVQPLYEAAIEDFEATRQLELEAIEASTNARISQITRILDELEKLSLSQLRIIVVSQLSFQESERLPNGFS